MLSLCNDSNTVPPLTGQSRATLLSLKGPPASMLPSTNKIGNGQRAHLILSIAEIILSPRYNFNQIWLYCMLYVWRAVECVLWIVCVKKCTQLAAVKKQSDRPQENSTGAFTTNSCQALNWNKKWSFNCLAAPLVTWHASGWSKLLQRQLYCTFQWQ